MVTDPTETGPLGRPSEQRPGLWCRCPLRPQLIQFPVSAAMGKVVAALKISCL
jgi:hypothetical protein